MDKVELAKEILLEAGKKKVDLELPLDFVIAPEAKEDAVTKVVDKDNIPAGWKGLDIGPKTEELFKQKIEKANTVVWNGPMGVFEVDKFAKGTMAVAKELAEVTRKNAVTIVGGGDSVAALAKANLQKKMTHVSTGGGASLEFLEGKTLPGIAALTDKK